MSKKRKFLDNQQVALDFDQPIEAYTRLRDELLRARITPAHNPETSYEEGCIEIAAAIKRAIRRSGLSREAVVDAVNDFFGWPRDDKRKGLSIHIFNHYLSKPTEYPIPAVYLPPIQKITHSLEPAGVLVEPEGGSVITREERQELALGKLDNAIQEMQRLKKEFRGKHT
jgi:hypothetical protein